MNGALGTLRNTSLLANVKTFDMYVRVPTVCLTSETTLSLIRQVMNSECTRVPFNMQVRMLTQQASRNEFTGSQ